MNDLVGCLRKARLFDGRAVDSFVYAFVFSVLGSIFIRWRTRVLYALCITNVAGERYSRIQSMYIFGAVTLMFARFIHQSRP
jgi:uncharacterized membrane protein